MMDKRAAIVSAVFALCVALVSGCSSQSQETATSGDMQAPAAGASAAAAGDTSAAVSDELALPAYGVEDAEGAVFALTNKAGQDITSFAVKPTGETEYSENLIPKGEAMANGSDAGIHLPKIEGAVSKESNIQTKPVADVRIVLADGTEYELHQLDVYDISEASVRLFDDIAYLEYASIASGATVSTLDAEVAWRDSMTLGSETRDGKADSGEEPTYYEESEGDEEEDCVPDVVLH